MNTCCVTVWRNMVNHKPCSVAEAQYLGAMHTFQKVIYNACSVVMLTVCMLMLCSSAQLSSIKRSAPFFSLRTQQLCASASGRLQFLQCNTKCLACFVAVPCSFPLVLAGMTDYDYKPRVKMHMNQHPFD